MRKKFKATIKPGISFEKVHIVVKFNLKAWLNSYIDMNTELRKKAKTDSEKLFSNYE